MLTLLLRFLFAALFNNSLITLRTAVVPREARYKEKVQLYRKLTCLTNHIVNLQQHLQCSIALTQKVDGRCTRGWLHVAASPNPSPCETRADRLAHLLSSVIRDQPRDRAGREMEIWEHSRDLDTARHTDAQMIRAA